MFPQKYELAQMIYIDNNKKKHYLSTKSAAY